MSFACIWPWLLFFCFFLLRTAAGVFHPKPGRHVKPASKPGEFKGRFFQDLYRIHLFNEENRVFSCCWFVKKNMYPPNLVHKEWLGGQLGIYPQFPYDPWLQFQCYIVFLNVNCQWFFSQPNVEVLSCKWEWGKCHNYPLWQNSASHIHYVLIPVNLIVNQDTVDNVNGIN